MPQDSRKKMNVSVNKTISDWKFPERYGFPMEMFKINPFQTTTMDFN